jgi:hypothetical protein
MSQCWTWFSTPSAFFISKFLPLRPDSVLANSRACCYLFLIHGPRVRLLLCLPIIVPCSSAHPAPQGRHRHRRPGRILCRAPRTDIHTLTRTHTRTHTARAERGTRRDDLTGQLCSDLAPVYPAPVRHGDARRCAGRSRVASPVGGGPGGGCPGGGDGGLGGGSAGVGTAEAAGERAAE